MSKQVRPAAPAAASTRQAPADEDIAKRMASQARQLFDDELSLRIGRRASDLNRFADALRGAAARLDGSVTAQYFDRAAGQVERVAEVIKDANGQVVIEGVQSFARQRPLLYLGSAVAVGIGVGRFLRSSSPSGLPMLASSTRSASSSPRSTRTTRKNNQPS